MRSPMTDLPKVGETVYMLTKPTKIEAKTVTGIDDPGYWAFHKHVRVQGPKDKWDQVVSIPDLSYDPPGTGPGSPGGPQEETRQGGTVHHPAEEGPDENRSLPPGKRKDSMRTHRSHDIQEYAMGYACRKCGEGDETELSEPCKSNERDSLDLSGLVGTLERLASGGPEADAARRALGLYNADHYRRQALGLRRWLRVKAIFG